MIKVDSTNGKVEFLFCVEVNEGYDRYTRSVYVNEAGEHFLIVSHEYHIGSAYDYVNEYYLLDQEEFELFEKIALDRERRIHEEALERERKEREDRERLLTAGDDPIYYKKKRSDTIWWLKKTLNEYKFTFDKEKVFNMMTDYPDKLTPEQKEIFDRENPYWAKRLQKEKGLSEQEEHKPVITYGDHITPEEYMELRRGVGWVMFPMEQAKACIDNAYMVMCVRADDKAIGVVRLLWDGGYIAFLSDVIVDAEFQGQGIGRKLVEACLNKLKSDMKPGYKVKITLNSARGKEPFYEKFGFSVRPNDDAGAGMDQWLIKEEQ